MNSDAHVVICPIMNNEEDNWYGQEQQEEPNQHSNHKECQMKALVALPTSIIEEDFFP